MNFQKLLKASLIALCISSSLPVFSNPLSPETTLAIADDTKPAKTTDPAARLQEIRNMDIASLSRAQKKDLRKEVKEMRKEIRAGKSGIYLSLGAVIIIVLLILIL